MWVMRLLAVLLVVAVGVSLLAYVLTGNRVYIRFAGRLFRYTLVVVLLLFALLFVERVAVIPL